MVRELIGSFAASLIALQDLKAEGDPDTMVSSLSELTIQPTTCTTSTFMHITADLCRFHRVSALRRRRAIGRGLLLQVTPIARGSWPPSQLDTLRRLPQSSSRAAPFCDLTMRIYTASAKLLRTSAYGRLTRVWEQARQRAGLICALDSARKTFRRRLDDR